MYDDRLAGATARPPETKELTCQVLVLGGGLPGVCAAVQAAQLGMDVILVEQRMTLGGNCGPEIGVHPSDAHRFHPYMVSTGTVGSLIEEAAFVHAKTDSNDHHYNVSMRWDTVMVKKLERSGVRLLRSHYAHTPYVKDGKIVAVLCEDTLTYCRVLIHVTSYVIDDSGDGNVSERAGATYRMGREARSEFNESLAPEQAEKTTMGASLVSLIRDTGKESPYYPEPDIPPFYPGYGGDCGPFEPEEGASLYFWFPTETGGDLDTVADGHTIYRRVRGHMDSAWNEMKNVKDRGGARNWEMVWCSSEMGKRESRRFEGDYILNQNDLQVGRHFEDAIAVGGFALDIHYPRPEWPEVVKITYHLIPPVYTIPYRSIYSKDIGNLFFASRLLSVSHLAHGSVRLQRTLATIGQAAGIAAAMCAEYGITPRELYTKGHIHELQQKLLKWDATIPNAVNEDEEDLARQATVTASSELTYGVPGMPVFEKAGSVSGVELWNFTDRIDTCDVLLRNPTDKDIHVCCHLEHFVPDHPWQYKGERKFFDYYPHHNEAEWGSEHRTRFFKPVAQCSIVVPAGFEGYASIPFGAAMTPKNPHTDDDRMAVVLRPDNDCLEIGRSNTHLSYMRDIRGVVTSEDGSEAYLVGPSSVFAKIFPTPCYGEASQVLNGYNRRFSENPQNMWLPAQLPADLTLSWDETVKASEVHITFDTLERSAWDMPYENNRRASGQCVKRFRLSLIQNEKEVYTVEQENHNRLAVLCFPEQQFDRLVLTVLETWDPARMPGVYEIRVYR